MSTVLQALTPAITAPAITATPKTASAGATAYLNESKRFHSLSDQEIIEASQTWLETLKG